MPSLTGQARPQADLELHAKQDSNLPELLRHVFLDSGAVARFVVLRNDEGLPVSLTGTDLDLSVLPGTALQEAFTFIEKRATLCGWNVAFVSRRPHTIGFALLGPNGGAIHFDLFRGISCLGIPIVRPHTIHSESCAADGMRRLSQRGKVLVTVAHHIAWNGGLEKSKYVAELDEVLSNPADREWFLARTEEAFGRPLIDILGRDWADGSHAPSSRRRRRALIGLVRHGLRNRPVETLRGIAAYGWGHVTSSFRPAGLVGRPGDRIASDGDVVLTLSVACSATPHGFRVPTMRSSGPAIETRNGPRYQTQLERTWRRWMPVRWLAPSIFLWTLAKRNRVVLVGRPPLLIRLARSSRFRPEWIAMPPSKG